MGDIAGLFTPARVAVVGATPRDGAVGRAIFENLLDEFEGEVVPVTPAHESILGVPCVDRVADADADLVVVVVPADAAVSVVREAGVAGVKHVVVISAGFGESGSDGAARERELVAVAEEYDLTLVGPNCLGIVSTPVGLNATFAPQGALAGSISFMSQSGAFVTAVLDWAADRGVGFKDVVSLGNKAVVDETDLLATWGADPETDVILAYLEGIDDGRAFVETAREVTAETPVVLLKSGRTDAGARAAASHTGAIAGSDRAYEAGLSQAGVIRARTVQDLFDAGRALAGQPLPESGAVAVVTNAGGPGVLATDAIGDAETLSLASLGDETVTDLRESLPPSANVYNPVDVLGDASVDRFERALETILADEHVGGVVALSAPTATLSYPALASTIADCQRRYETPLIAALMGGTQAETADRILSDAGIPNYFDPARAVASLDALARSRSIRERTYDPPTRFEVEYDRARERLSTATEQGRTRLGVEAMGLLDDYDIPTPDGAVVSTPTEAACVAGRFDGPVVMKLVSPDILHKSDIGGVKVGVDQGDVPAAYEDLVTRARRYQPDATILGVQVQELVSTEDGVETIVGTTRDAQFGPLVLFGLGGIFVEVLRDTTVRVAPVSAAEARAMTEDIESAPLLRGARGRPPVDIDGVVEALQRLSQLALDFPAILELDVNPLVARPDGVCALDVRLTLDPEQL